MKNIAEYKPLGVKTVCEISYKHYKVSFWCCVLLKNILISKLGIFLAEQIFKLGLYKKKLNDKLCKYW